MFRVEEVVEFPEENLSVRLSRVPTSPDSVNLANNFPAQIFGPGSSNNTTKTENQLRILSPVGCIKEDCSNSSCFTNSSIMEMIEKEQNWEKKTLPNGADNQNSNKESYVFILSGGWSLPWEEIWRMKPSVLMLTPWSLSVVLIQTLSRPRTSSFLEEPPVLGDGQQLRTNEASIQRNDIMARIAVSTMRNSPIKAHRKNNTGPGEEQWDGLQEWNKQEVSHASDMKATFVATWSLTPSSMEEWITTTNQKSMAAHDEKLLQSSRYLLIWIPPLHHHHPFFHLSEHRLKEERGQLRYLL